MVEDGGTLNLSTQAVSWVPDASSSLNDVASTCDFQGNKKERCGELVQSSKVSLFLILLRTESILDLPELSRHFRIDAFVSH